MFSLHSLIAYTYYKGEKLKIDKDEIDKLISPINKITSQSNFYSTKTKITNYMNHICFLKGIYVWKGKAMSE